MQETINMTIIQNIVHFLGFLIRKVLELASVSVIKCKG
jgi:hypothetical protein